MLVFTLIQLGNRQLRPLHLLQQSNFVRDCIEQRCWSGQGPEVHTSRCAAGCCLLSQEQAGLLLCQPRLMHTALCPSNHVISLFKLGLTRNVSSQPTCPVSSSKVG